MSHHRGRRLRASTPLPDEESDSSSSRQSYFSDGEDELGERVRGGDGMADASAAETFRPTVREREAPRRLSPPTRLMPRTDTESSDDFSDDDRGEPRRRTFSIDESRREATYDTRAGEKRKIAPGDVRAVRRSQAQKEIGIKPKKLKSALKQTSAYRIPYYNDTPGRAAIPRAERDVVIDEQAFEALVGDTPSEFQRAFKPPHAATVPDHKMAEMKEFEVLDGLSELKLRNEDWYAMIVLVAGMLQVSVTTLIDFTPPAMPGVAPTRASITGQFSGVGGNASGTTANSADRALAQLVGMTPVRTENFGDFALPTDPLPPRPPRQDFFADRVVEQDVLDAAPGLPPQSVDQVDAAISSAIERAVTQTGVMVVSAAQFGSIPLNQQQVPLNQQHVSLNQQRMPLMSHTGARFKKIRDQMEARAPETPAYATRNTQADRELNQSVRATAATARQWAARATATGIYMPKPAYLGARDSAYTDLVTRAPHLAPVDMAFFMRQGATTTPQHRIRVMFARLIAAEYNMITYNSNRSSKRITDADNYVGAAENCLLFFVRYVTFSRHTQSFSISTDPADPRRALDLPRGRKPYLHYDPHSAVSAFYSVPPECNPLLMVPGTLTRPRRGTDISLL